MYDIFLKILNMSIAAGWLILAVALLRFALKKAPKWVAVLLWGIVALRLVVPVSFESALSLVPSAETFSAHNIQYETPAIHSGITALNNAVNPILGEAFAPNPAASVNPLYVWTFVVSVIWLIGVAAMLLYAVISYARIRRRVAESLPHAENIFLCDQVRSPFILGLLRPKIYLPSGLDAAAIEPVIAHERAHLVRRDHWWKPLGFLILAVHWFNPLCWLAYVLLCRDIELACDEKVIRQLDLDGKKRYSTALLACSTGRRLATVCPLAFGEVGVKERVKSVLHYKKPAVWLIVVAVAACAVVTVCFATNPKQAPSQAQRVEALREKYPEYFDLGTFKGLELYVWQMAENDYRFGLMPGTNRVKTEEEILALPGASAEEMALILSTYEIEDENIFITPFLHPASSYMLPEDQWTDPEYTANIRAMLGLDGASTGPSPEAAAPPPVAPNGLDDTDKVIGSLLETICSSPAQSSNPGDYIAAHPTEYRELTDYGQYTLQYCFARFEAGGETGLAGHVMWSLCRDIAASWGEDLGIFTAPLSSVPPEQQWYDAFKTYALNLLAQYTEMELAEQYPASYLLLDMLGEVSQ